MRHQPLDSQEDEIGISSLEPITQLFQDLFTRYGLNFTRLYLLCSRLSLSSPQLFALSLNGIAKAVQKPLGENRSRGRRK